ncbi:MAG: hypothetical protein KDI73_04695, partial [Candidatus Competibacteraceae bacterium]|nr:hypothetical protein [Candidatus Competibacteraceae bacterium]
MAHLELAYLLASPRSKGSASVAAGSVTEAGQEAATQSPSFGQWLRTSILRHPTAGETDRDLKEDFLVPEEPLDSSNGETVNVQAPRNSQQGIESTNSDALSIEDLQMAPENLQSDDFETGSETEVSTAGSEQQALIQAGDEIEIISTPNLGTEKLFAADESPLKKPITPIANNRGVTVHSPRPLTGEGLANLSPCQEIEEETEYLHNRGEGRPETPDKEPRIEMPWAGFSLFMES